MVHDHRPVRPAISDAGRDDVAADLEPANQSLVTTVPPPAEGPAHITCTELAAEAPRQGHLRAVTVRHLDAHQGLAARDQVGSAREHTYLRRRYRIRWSARRHAGYECN